MERDLIINSSPTDVEIAFLEDNKLVELHKQKTNSNFSVGDIYLGKIRKTMPGLNAAFVDLGHRKDAFLHYTDIGPQINSLKKYTLQCLNKEHKSAFLDNFLLEPDNSKNGKIDQVFHKGMPVLVQILKEPISTKGPRLSCEITIPGRNMVLVPFSDTVAVSKKIADAEERKRLKVLVESIKPKKFGVIIRTAAEGKKVADLHGEIKELSEKWEEVYRELISSKNPHRLLSEIDKTSSLLRDLLNDNFNKIIVNDKDTYQSLKDFLKNIAPEKANIIKHYSGTKPIFDEYGVLKQLKASFGKTSTMSSGAYIVIEHAEAMHVIDVNSGPKMQNMSQEDAAIRVNVEAAQEIARQLRLRDIGGLIVIDFIDMRNGDNKLDLFNKMKEFMKADRAQHTILPLSKFGLMQITRQRVKPAMKIDTREVCAACKGTGMSESSFLVSDDVVRDFNFIMRTRPDSKIRIEVNPLVHAYMTKGFKSIQMKLSWKNRKWIKISPNMDYHLFEYKFFDTHNDEIRLD
ncbi:MAG TPA: Rne/Rng family ribonuclease [Saprospiraceae bacterium]|nr:Rne/Rng family ribonuclease [Saprospiraceae bacterium]MCB9328855.1 Rne/Rng family ribonuclease [Lewinellaceae bacterium]HPK08887.1 Rne/Rng family ribonuclease [Saprospiraceae bacterium]HPQ20339.1 Rne/Rng family ribonuclease [Saprospiraceae bacterium]HRX28455.1 Rne/Rng family ribonuclease [Saprospiraceae bacterium]